MPQAQFLNRIVDVRVVTQRQIAVKRVQKKIVIPNVQRLARWSMVLLCRFTGLRHGKRRLRPHSRRPCSNTLRALKSRRVNSGSTHGRPRFQQTSPESDVDVPVATQRQVQYIDKIDDMIQSMVKHMVDKVEMNVVMPMAGIRMSLCR